MTLSLVFNIPKQWVANEVGAWAADNYGMADRIRARLDAHAVPMEQAEFSREEYNRLFPEGKIETPLGIVKLGHDQFDK